LRKRNTFLFFWIFSTGLLVWFLYQGHHTFDDPSTKYVLLALLFCTVALLIWLAGPVNEITFEHHSTKRGWFSLFVIITIVGAFLARTIIGPPLVFALPILAIGILIFLRPKINRQEVLYAAVLALVAGLTGLSAGWVSFHPIIWSVLQVCLVVTGLIAGWSLLRYTDLWQIGIGRSQYLDEGIKSALLSFGFGLILSIPWAIGIVLIGGADSQQWVQRWWHPFMAFSPGISEEVWGRVLLIPTLFILLRRVIRPRRAYILALLMVSYWFAYLHTSGGIEGIVSTVMIGTLYVLPLTYICFHRDLETAIGFHFSVDFAKFVAAFFLNAGIWLS